MFYINFVCPENYSSNSWWIRNYYYFNLPSKPCVCEKGRRMDKLLLDNNNLLDRCFLCDICGKKKVFSFNDVLKKYLSVLFSRKLSGHAKLSLSWIMWSFEYNTFFFNLFAQDTGWTQMPFAKNTIFLHVFGTYFI